MFHKLCRAIPSLRFSLLFSCTLSCVLLIGMRARADDWQAGVATANITPPQLMWMAGYGNRNHPAESKLTDLWAKALVLEDAKGQRAALLTLDLVGIDRELSQRICRSLKTKHALARHQVSICTSHTHCGPVVGRNLGPLHYLLVDKRQQQLIDDYADRLHDQLVDLVGKAIADIGPATLAAGEGSCDVAVNRRENPAAEVLIRRAAGTLRGPFDHDVPVLSIRDESGKLKSVVFGYACHATTLSFYQWCGDYPGYAQAELERRRPGCVAMFWAGCGADQNPLPRREVALAKKYGAKLADSVEQVLDGEMPPLSSQLKTMYQEFPAPLAPLPERDHWESLAKSGNKYEQARAKMLLARLDQGQELSTTYPYPVQCWQLGDVAWYMLGGEVVVDYALRLKHEMKGQPVWVAGYANDVMAYIPSRRVLREGGYEGGGSMVYYGLPAHWAPEIEDAIVNVAVAMNQPSREFPTAIDLNDDVDRQVVVDREPGQYLGHPTTCLLEDGKTMLCVYPKGHGRGAIVYKRSNDGGKTWSDRLPTPKSWATSKEVPTIHRVIDANGKKRLIMWSGLYPARLAVSEDDGANWSELQPAGDWGGIVVMGFVEALRDDAGKPNGQYLAMFHDDGRFIAKDGKRSDTFKLYKTLSADGGLTWADPEVVYQSSRIHLCEPGCIRSPDGKTIAVLLRENARREHSHIIFSSDEGKTWSAPRPLPLALTGDRHTGKYGPDGRLLISFRCISPKGVQGRPFDGDWVSWVGTWEDLVLGRPGQYIVRMKDNTKGYDTTYPGVETLPDGAFVVTTYGHWDEGEQPYILSVRLKLDELDQKAKPAK